MSTGSATKSVSFDFAQDKFRISSLPTSPEIMGLATLRINTLRSKSRRASKTGRFLDGSTRSPQAALGVTEGLRGGQFYTDERREMVCPPRASQAKI
jgi:hypothetical protein